MNKKVKKSNFNQPSRQSMLIVSQEVELLEFLVEQLKDKTRNKVKGMLKHKHFKVNNVIVTQFDFKLTKEDKVLVNWDSPHKKTTYEGIKVVHEDDDVIVINKRSGLLSVGSTKQKKYTAYNLVMKYLQQDNPTARPFVVHRLDKDVSGLMVFAKHKSAEIFLKKTWKDIAAKNLYLLIAEGTVKEDEALLISYLTVSKALIVHETNNKKTGKLAETKYSIVKKNEHFSLVEAWMLTEVKHQIRVQFQSLGHPVVGDKKYGSTTNPLNRMALHLRKLYFIHPTTNKEMCFETKVPEDFLNLFRVCP